MEFESYALLTQEDVQATKLSKRDLKELIKSKTTIAPNVQFDMAGRNPRMTVIDSLGNKSVGFAGDYLLKNADGTFSVESKNAFEAKYVKSEKAE